MKQTFKTILLATIFFIGVILTSGFLQILPEKVFALTGSAEGNAVMTNGSFASIACSVTKLILGLVPLLVVIAVVAFLQGLIKYVAHGDNEEKRTEGTKMMLYGIVGFFFMVAIWGILKIFVASFGMSVLEIPQLKGTSFTCS